MEMNTVSNTTLDVLLNRCKCIPAKGSTLSELLTVHQILKSGEQALAPTLAEIEIVEEFGIQFRSENRDCLELLDYVLAVFFTVLYRSSSSPQARRRPALCLVLSLIYLVPTEP